MPLSDVLAAERERLLTPVSPENPTGVAIRYDDTYDSIAELRREDDTTLPQGEWVRSLKQADWKACASLCVSTLESKTKDLQIAAWLTESLFMLHGTAGARAGLRLIKELSELYWKDLHPGTPDDDEARIVALEWLDEKLSQRLKTLKISAPAGDTPAYLYHEWEQASYLENLAKKAGASGAAAADAATRSPTRSKIEASWQQTPQAFIAGEVAEVDALIAEAEGLATTLDGFAGREAPSLRRIRAIATSVKEALLRSGRMPVATEPEGEMPPATEDASADREDTEAAVIGVPGSAITSRAEAYRRLQQIADYLLRTEPHSPSGYLVQRAVRWGNASLATVLTELSQDPSNLRNMLSLLGIEGEETDRRE